ncbi:hypothetical protein DAEQUDRAFT_740914 [Daedalea quercina L-15889]|uniref:Uncharacterized protein n=1 Tax=Daedalea quercina L-15889 TaxID=1314783 RepID=A0A165LZK3_9APHY|nr:hypothetical protein DAEQUDRAFT_740914 [Daedalea quercina L-15889]
MSSTFVQEVNLYLRSARIANYCLATAFTLGQEIDYIWRSRSSTASALYILLQIVTVFFFVLNIISQFFTLDCNVYCFLRGFYDREKAYPEEIATYVSNALFNVTVSVISSLRVYALNPRDMITPAMVLILSLGPAANEVATSTTADVIVLLVTWRKTYHTIRLARQERISAPLSALLLRDGTIYFGLITIIDILGIVFYTTEVFGGFSYFAYSFTSIILTRFFLNLRKASLGNEDTQASQSPWSESGTHLSRGAGSLGGSIAFVVGENGGPEQDSEADMCDGDDVLAEQYVVNDSESYGINEEARNSSPNR